jgi:hypothetical protein
MTKYFLLSLLLFCFQSFAKEGGNGGGVIICPNSIELYDFYEAKNSYPRIDVWKNDPRFSMEDYLGAALNHLKSDIPEVHDLVEKMVKSILGMPKNQMYVNVTIPMIEDATITVLGRGCQYEQAANWNERFKKLFISERLFGKLDGLNQAGLIMHEAIYKLSRDTFVATETSDKVRAVVAKIFSDERLDKYDAEIILSQSAKDESTRPICLETKRMITDVENLLKKGDDKETRSLLKETVDLCLRGCFVKEIRTFCEKRL